MKKIHLIGALFLLTACQQTECIEFENSSKSQLSVSHNIATIENYISKTKGINTRSGNHRLIPYIVNGDTVMYVANYENGGFEIFSNDKRLPMVLVKSKTGYFIPNNPADKSPFEAYISDTADCLQKIGIDSTAEPTGLWNVYAVSRLRNENENENGAEYRNVGIATEIDEKEWTPKGGRLSTKWNQDSYFNQCIPYFTDGSGYHAYVGCGAVAVGQYIFHSNKFFNLPQTTVTDATYNQNTNSFTFSGSSSNVWSQMNDGSDPLMYKDQQRMLPTSIFLGYVAKELNSQFGQNYGDGTGTYTYSYVNFIRRICGKELNVINFNFVKTRDILASGYPVIATSSGSKIHNGNTNYVGHAYIIDYASTYVETYYDVYAYVKTSDNYVVDDKEDVDSESNNLEYYRNKYGEIFFEQSATVSNSWISMNWGWGGNYGDLMINSKLSEWIIDRGSDTLKFNWNSILY